MNREEAIKIINKVGEDFGWQMGKISANYENGYMQAIRDCKAMFAKFDNEVNGMVVNGKKMKMLKKSIYDECFDRECEECTFFDEWDETDDEIFCAIRDKDGNIPYNSNWDIESALGIEQFREDTKKIVTNAEVD